VVKNIKVPIVYNLDPENHSHHKIILWIEEILISYLSDETSFVKKEIQELLKLRESTSLC